MISQNLSYTGSYNPYDLIQQAGKKKRMNKRKSKKSNKSKKSRKSKKTRKYKK